LEQCTIHGNTFTTTGKNNSLSAGIAVLGANVDIFSSTISANTVSGDAYGSGALAILAMAQAMVLSSPRTLTRMELPYMQTSMPQLTFKAAYSQTTAQMPYPVDGVELSLQQARLK
jgi:energy-converting hydrogenase Eha subunit H